METLKITKPIILEGISLRKNAVIRIRERQEDNGYNNFDVDMSTVDSGEGRTKSDNRIRDTAQKLLKQAEKEGLIDSNNRTQREHDLYKLVQGNYARYQEAPSMDVVREYLRTRGPGYAT